MNPGCSSSHGGSERFRNMTFNMKKLIHVRPNNRLIYRLIHRCNVTEEEVGMTMEESACKHFVK
jgi:hypothetical protein